jgi:glutathione-specific gamma-glutamylcyclotransferase
MWIFGYGSLMFDGWETAHGCIDRKWANLPGYRRSFNKKSVESRGTPKFPGLTLNLVADEFAKCRGVAFRFEGNGKEELLRLVARREACKGRELPILIDGVRAANAWVYIYEGKNLIDEQMPPAKKAAMVLKAKGIRGSDFDYVKMVYEGLGSVGIDDQAVSELWQIVKEQSQHAAKEIE